MTNPKQATDAQRPICDKPGCGLPQKALRLLGIPVYWVCPRTIEEHRLCAQLAAATADLEKVQEKAKNWKLHSEHLQSQFQNETLRSWEYSQLVKRFMERSAARGCTADPWVKDDCADCTLMREGKALLESPINRPAIEASEQLKEANARAEAAEAELLEANTHRAMLVEALDLDCACSFGFVCFHCSVRSDTAALAEQRVKEIRQVAVEEALQKLLTLDDSGKLDRASKPHRRVLMAAAILNRADGEKG